MFDRACAIASHIVYIRHPSFEHEEYLASLGLKQYWTDWPGVHTTHIRLHEFVAMAERNDVYDVTVRPLKRGVDSDDPTILPIDAPPNQRKPVREVGAYGVYDEAKHGPSRTFAFDRPVYFAFDIFFFLRADAPAVRYPRDSETASRDRFSTGAAATPIRPRRPCSVGPPLPRVRAWSPIARRLRLLRLST